MFALGQDGIALEHNHQFLKLSFAQPEFATSVTGLVEDRAGHVWINGSRAIARISAEEIAAAVTDASHSIIAREFREADFRGSDFFGYARNSAQIDARGRLWFPTSNGVVYVDPQHLDRALPLPSLSIRSITVDGQPLNAKRTFGPGAQTLDVRYFGLNLSDPTRVVYRYKLKNYEAGWQDAGNRTEAIYTHLQPGKYMFQVAALECRRRNLDKTLRVSALDGPACVLSNVVVWRIMHRDQHHLDLGGFDVARKLRFTLH